ncbi:LOW QUALITY PROTEIN: mRNA-decapping enzyme 1B [Hippocampus zosterae]|uniref:LOW QUALITY PROTEIN: mRNA-decapping enzyme 1B n=1 Tax=Hippocampus zosterae TaxID=109293 RepID=UPI00223CA4FA|nr:LOW QUALITY PROTEIN: mRNA-decapping enzyme 1B [Hippocampus zosterae]
MTATCADGGGGLSSKGLDISLAALQRHDPYIKTIVDVASQVALYTYNNRANEWEKTEVEGTLFIYTRQAASTNTTSCLSFVSTQQTFFFLENLTEPITKDLDFQLQDPFLLYRNARLVIHGIWFYDKADCRRIAQRIKTLIQQEQAVVQGGWLPPGGGEGVVQDEGRAVDIIQMLTKAHSQYDKEKATCEPKEIGGSGVLFGKPNLIKPIPVKPTTQDDDASESKPLSLATLFGSHHQPSPKADSASPSAAPVARKASRPPVARTLTYETSAPKAITPTEDVSPRHQNCPAILKLMQGQRAAPGGVLQTLSESPENRLVDNGVPLDPHHHHHMYHHQMHHQHQLDPIKRLFQNAPAPCCAAPCSHQQAFFGHSKQPHPGAPPHIPGVLSPHELVHKLQLVQQEQSQAPQEAPRLGPALAPRFQVPSSVAVAAPKAALQFQAPSPQRIPATVAPTLLLSPSVFSQKKSGVLSKSQLQATLLHLIQTDGSFLDTIYEAYVGNFC